MFYRALVITLYASLQATLCTIISLIIALAVAYFLWRYQCSGYTYIYGLLYMYSCMPTKAAALAINFCYGAHGMVSVTIALLMLNIPYASIMMHQAYAAALDHESIATAAGFGASSWQWYKDIALPQLVFTIQRTARTIFTLCFCSLSFCPVLGNQWYHTTPESMMQSAYYTHNTYEFMLYALLRLLVLGIVWYGEFLHEPTSSMIMPIDNPRIHTLAPVPNMARCTFALLVLFLIIPCGVFIQYGINHGMLAYLSTVINGDHDLYLTLPALHVVYNSMLVACSSSFLALGISSVLCFTSTIYPTYTQSILALPFLAGSIGCSLMCTALAGNSWLCGWPALIISHALLNYPYAYYVLQPHYQQHNQELVATAQTYGANRWHTFTTITAPLLWPALRSAFCICFSLSITEVGATTTMYTLPTMACVIKIYKNESYDAGSIGMTCIVCIIAYTVRFLSIITA